MMNNHNTHPLPKREESTKIGCVIRKKDILENNQVVYPSPKNLKKQMITLLKRLKKKENIYTEYSIEKDKNGGYHVHLIIHCTNVGGVKKNLKKYIGGDNWKEKEHELRTLLSCESTYGYGYVDIEEINDEKKYRDYINKRTPSTTLV